MKRIIAILTMCLLCWLASAQQTYRFQYWFDDQYENTHADTSTNGMWQARIDVGHLYEGIHVLHLHVQDTMGRFSSPRAYMFYKMPDTVNDSWSYAYWFDGNANELSRGVIGSGHLLIDLAQISEGIHTLTMQIGLNGFSRIKEYLFYKVPERDTSLSYVCWFDGDGGHQFRDSIRDGHILLDVGHLSTGLHTIGIQLGKGNNAIVHNYFFYKMPEQDSIGDRLFSYWFDQDYYHRITDTIGNGHLRIDVNGLEAGIHTFTIQMSGQECTSLQQFLFLKDDLKIQEYEYWFNGMETSKRIIYVDPPVDTLNLITLLPVETFPIRSTCFHFSPNEDRPVLHAQNVISFRFRNNEYRYAERTMQYVDYNVVDEVYADTLERDTTKVIAAPRNNAIHWFKLSAGVGDSLSFHTDRRCTMQLYAPSGEMVFHASGDSVLIWTGCHAWESGVYYLAVHDAENAGDVSVSYQWIYRYAVLDQNVDTVGNGGVSIILFEGNGFDSLLSVTLVNRQNDTIYPLLLETANNIDVACHFDFENKDTGWYKAIFVFSDETIEIIRALYVDTAITISFVSIIDYPVTIIRQPHVRYKFIVRNKGNMTAFQVPICPLIKGNNGNRINKTGITITHITHRNNQVRKKAEPRLAFIKTNDYTHSIENKKDIQIINQIVENDFGDNLNMFSPTYANGSASSMTNTWYIDIAPHEELEIIIDAYSDMASTEGVSMSVYFPEEMPPLTIVSPHSHTHKPNWWCKNHELMECGLDIIGDGISVATLIDPELRSKIALSVISCVSSMASKMSDYLSDIACDENDEIDWQNAWERTVDDISAFVDDVTINCLHGAQPTVKMESMDKAIRATIPSIQYLFWCEANKRLNRVYAAVNVITLGGLLNDCVLAFTGLKGTETLNEVYTLLKANGDLYNCFRYLLQHIEGSTTYVAPSDPNEITGYLAESGSHAVGAEMEQLYYSIEFENDTTFATANAHTVQVIDTLDGDVFDLSSFAATSFSIGEQVVALNGEQSFIRTVDMRPAINVLAEVRLEYDDTSGIARWTFRSLDPMTLQETTDPTLGFLPANYNGDGIGQVDFLINRKSTLRDSAIIDNRAYIVFDNETPIATSTWHNIMDITPPVSSIDSVISTSGMATVAMSATDNLSGVWRYHVYAQENTMWQRVASNVPADSVAMFVAETNTYTAFRTTAIDSAGNVELLDRVVDTTAYDVPLAVNANTWYAISSPTHNTAGGNETVDGVVNLVGDNFAYDLFYYDESNATWRNYKAHNFDLEPGVGYLYRRSAADTLRFTGQPNSGGEDGIEVTLTANWSNSDLRGFNLIGNPYPYEVGYGAPYYELRPNGTWYAHTSGVIDVAQGFLVHTTTPTTYTFTYPTPDNAKGTERMPLAFTVAGNGYEDVVYALFDEGEGLPKLGHLSADAPALSIDGKAIAVLGRETEEFPLTLRAMPGDYALTAHPAQLYYLHLIDKATGADRDLLADSSYTFRHRGHGSDAERFVVRLAPAMHGAEGETFAYTDGTSIVVRGEGLLQVFDMLGRLVMTCEVNSERHIPVTHFHTGVYALRLDGKSQKIVIR